MMPYPASIRARGSIILAVLANQRCHCDPEHDSKYHSDHNNKKGSRILQALLDCVVEPSILSRLHPHGVGLHSLCAVAG